MLESPKDAVSNVEGNKINFRPIRDCPTNNTLWEEKKKCKQDEQERRERENLARRCPPK
jgi:hypothetical protein